MKKVIELTGVNFINKGAELMLYAIVQQFTDNDKYKLVTDFTVGSFEERTSLGLYQKFRINPLGFTPDNLNENAAIQSMKKDQKIYDQLFNNGIGKGLGLVNPRDIDVIFDASGFRYSSQWGDFKTQRAEILYNYWKSQGKKIFLLPQAYGPFETESIKKSFKTIIETVDLILVRDRQSYKHIMELCPEHHNYKVKIFPDFTCLIEGQNSSKYAELKGRVCIIPNYRMKDKTDLKSFNFYLNILIETTVYLKKNNIPFFYLIHETGSDMEIINEIKKRVGFEIPVIEEGNPLEIKSIISKSNLVIGSRYHGLISALVSNVPSIGLGWSHKYNELFRDFEADKYLIDNYQDYHIIFETIDQIYGETNYLTDINFDKGIKYYVGETQKMWSLINSMM